MCVLICNGETIGVEPNYTRAVREARVAARLFGTAVTIYNLLTKETVQWI